MLIKGLVQAGKTVFQYPNYTQVIKKGKNVVNSTIRKSWIKTPAGKFTFVSGTNNAGKTLKAFGFIGERGERVVLRPTNPAVYDKACGFTDFDTYANDIACNNRKLSDIVTIMTSYWA